jgi:hypothetical protein
LIFPKKARRNNPVSVLVFSSLQGWQFCRPLSLPGNKEKQPKIKPKTTKIQTIGNKNR